MTKQAFYFSKTMFLTACFTLGCTSGGVMGCSDDGDGALSFAPELAGAEDLLGIYEIDDYQASPLDEVTGDPVPGECEQLNDIPKTFGDFLVLYPFEPNDAMGEALLAGTFCTDLDNCRAIADTNPEPTVGYSFVEGSEASGWLGFGNARQGPSTDQCLVDLQTHNMTASGNMITINTETKEVVFEPGPSSDGNTLVCRVGDAIAAFDPEAECKSRIFLTATRTASP